MCVFEISKQTLKLFRMGLFWDAHDREEEGGRQKDPPPPKLVTHPTMKELGSCTLLEEDPKKHKSRDTPLELC